MRNIRLPFSVLVLICVICAVINNTTTAQKTGAKPSTTIKPQGGKGIPNYTVPQLRQELERRAAAGEQDEGSSQGQSHDKSIPAPNLTPTFSNESALSKLTKSALFAELLKGIQGIYGDDDRKDINHIRAALASRNQASVVAKTGFSVDSMAVLQNVDSVVALMKEDRLKDSGKGTTSIIQLGVYGLKKDLCKSEKFYSQPTTSHCTGVLVAPRVIATAAHCFRHEPLQSTRFVFGYKMIDDVTPALIIKTSEVYRGERIIKMVYTNDGPDWALVELDRDVPVTEHTPVKIRSEGRVVDGDPLYVIGFPSGIPLKYADGAFVRANSESAYFLTNLDTFHGNSGSPVFNARTNLLEGILVRGEEDFDIIEELGRKCRRSKQCKMDTCRGEDCTRASEFISAIPQS